MASSGKQATDTRTRMIGLAVGLVVVLVAGLIAWSAAGDAEDREAERELRDTALEDIAGDPVITGDGLPPAGDPENDEAIGQPAPTVVGADFEGNPVSIGDTGNPQLIVFMASWCSFCREELPEVAEWLAEGGPDGDVEVIAVSTLHRPTETNWPPNAWFDRVGYPGAVLVDDAEGSVSSAFGLTGTPYWVAIDADGIVQVRASGRQSMDTIEQLATLLASG